VVRYTSDTDGHTLATHRSADAGSKRGVGWVGETAPNALHETSRVKGSPRLRQSLAALGSGYGLNEKPALRAKRIRDREAMIRPKKASLCYASMPT
jgi:hypothetical protein